MHGVRARPSAWQASFAVASVAACLLVQPARSGAGVVLECQIDGRYLMGTVFQATLCGVEETAATASRQPMHDVFAIARRYDALFTTYAADSPLSRLNATAGQGARSVPPELADVLRLSRQYAELTHGAFDITVRPLLQLWRQAALSREPPAPDRLADTLRFVGSRKIRFVAPDRVALPESGMALDLGGIAKGYALDRIVERLREHGVASALLNFGQSSLSALGRPPDAAGWRLALRRPDGRVVGYALLSGQAMSISAGQGQSRQIAGRRYGHIIDPRTGLPVERDLLACVVAPGAAQAEVLSTALIVLDQARGLALVERLPGVEALLLDATGSPSSTTGWQTATRFEAAS